MLQKLIFLLFIGFTVASCQFTETMVINEDGSGRMSITMDMGEMMAFGGSEMTDSLSAKLDTIIPMKYFLEEKKDSIAKLSATDQQKLKKLENYNLRLLVNDEKGEMLFSVYTNFKSINEANDLMSGLEQTATLMPGLKADAKDGNSPSKDILGVSYSYENGLFKRDAFIKDKKLHQQQVDSLKETESFMGGMKYNLKYTFPKKIVKSSVEDATYSLDGKTIEIERSFIEYFKNPDVLDLEVELRD